MVGGYGDAGLAASVFFRSSISAWRLAHHAGDAESMVQKSPRPHSIRMLMSRLIHFAE